MKKINVGIVNYGMGNIRSIENSLLHLGCKFKILNKPDKIFDYSHLILPGVGSFKKAIQNLKIEGLHEALQESVNKIKIILHSESLRKRRQVGLDEFVDNLI